MKRHKECISWHIWEILRTQSRFCRNTISIFKKKFGQNFLIDTGILEEIIDSAGITKDDMILEIGRE